MMTSRIRGGFITDVILVCVLLVLAYVFITRRSASFHPMRESSVLRESRHGEGNEGTFLIDHRVKSMKDLRSADCKGQSYVVKQKVSVIIHFHNYEFYDVKAVISSVLHNTPDHLLGEILLIDDGSTQEHIKAESRDYVRKILKSKLLTSEIKVGVARMRMLGLQHVRYDMVVFVDKAVLVGQGWLEPLIQTLVNHPDSIATPHFDHIKEPVSYDLQATSDKLISTFSWSMATRVTESKGKKLEGGLYETPVLRGNIFAVWRKYFAKIGGYSDFEDIGGEHFELSVRAWLCGGPIYVVTCSHVGVLNLNDPVNVSSNKNVRRIAELWFNKHKENIYSLTQVDPNLIGQEKTALERARQESQKRVCKEIDWYVKEIVQDIATASENAKFFGLLRCKSGRCARVGKDGRLDLGPCDPQQYGVHAIEMIFELDKEGYIRTGGRCLSTDATAYVVASECKKGDDHQIYTYNDSKILNNKWSGFCLMHVTDPDTKTDGKRQIAMAQACRSDASGEFSKWEFLPL